ncbi:DUF6790 family protein [Rhabdochromatium marinum]|uniref:DUF6790 family protein n=1 Tax=Rhabdochromatium marinum TaxID=48729 RepID=UPI0019076947|nr:DUF6790 family protein [Rhabdochromatium marinum]MBK1647182.1 hypothetical protein [Rhabdochromatium marinum]
MIASFIELVELVELVLSNPTVTFFILGVAGVIAFWQGLSFRVATFIPPALFLLGAAGGHVYQILTTENLAPGNAGSILWTDLLLPVVGFALLYAQ